MHDIEHVGNALRLAKEHGLSCEVILTALNAMKNNVWLTIEEALSVALGEWDV